MAKNILIVDDSATMRKVIMRGLRQAGIENADCKEAANGREGMKTLDATTFDLILSDVNMPNMNGFDSVKAVTAKLPTPPPIAMLTAEGDDVVAPAMTSGAKGYRQKPLTPEKVQEVIGPFLK